MSSWKNLRQAIDNFYRGYYRIDDWFLDPPDPEAAPLYPPNRGIRYPVTDVRVVRSKIGCEVSATLSYELKYWHSPLLEYHQLPLVELEVLLLNGLMLATNGAIEGTDGLRIETNSPGVIVDRADRNIPWLTTLPFNLDVVGAFEIEDALSLQPANSSASTFSVDEILLQIEGN